MRFNEESRSQLRKAIEILVEDYGKGYINLSKIIGKENAEPFGWALRSPPDRIPLDELAKDTLLVSSLWKYFTHLLPEDTDRHIEIFLDFLLNEKHISRPNDFTRIKPIDDQLTIVGDKLQLPTTRWKDGVRIESYITFDSLPKAIRSAKHAIDSLSEEYQENNRIINLLDELIRTLPRLGRESTDEERRDFIVYVGYLGERLKRKQHKLKIEARDYLIGKYRVNVIDMLSSSKNPYRISHRLERNWPAARAMLVAAKQRFIARNIEILEKMIPGMDIRKNKLLAKYKEYQEIHKHLDGAIPYILQFVKMKDVKPKDLEEPMYHIRRFATKWLGKYKDSEIDYQLYEAGQHLVSAMDHLMRGEINRCLDELFSARICQVRHYILFLMDKEGKGITIPSELPLRNDTENESKRDDTGTENKIR